MATRPNALLDPRWMNWAPGPVNQEADAGNMGGLYGAGYDWQYLDPAMTQPFYSQATGGGDASAPGAVDEQALRAWLASTGNQIKSYNEGDTQNYNVFGPDGAALGDTQTYNPNSWHEQLAHRLTAAGILAGGAAGGAFGTGGGAEQLGDAGGYGFTSAEAPGVATELGSGLGDAGLTTQLTSDFSQLPQGFDTQYIGANGGQMGTIGQGSIGGADLATIGQMTAPELASVPAVSGAANGAATGWGALGSSLGDFLSGKGNASDYGRVAQGLFGLYSQNKATDAAQQGAQQQNALIREAMAKNQPLIDTRDQALGGINALMRDPSTVAAQPDYQFGLKQGQDQINNSMAARGGYYSGQQLKASQKFGQDYAGSKLDQSLNRLMGVAGLGQIGSNQNNGLTLNLGQGMANAGNIRGSGYIGMGNTASNTVGDMVNDWTNRKVWGGP